MKDNEQVLDLIIIDNITQIIIPQHLFLKKRKIQLVSARWDYGISQDGVNNQKVDNLIIQYTQPNCVNPIYQLNNVFPPAVYDSYHSYYIGSIRINTDFAKSWDETGVCTNLLARMTLDVTQMDVSNGELSSFGLDQNEGLNVNTFILPENQQSFNLWFEKEVGNFGNINDPTDPQQTKWKYLLNEPMFADSTTQPIQPQPNFNRPIYIRFKIIYY